MLRASDSETEILLGNKQLLGIFFVVVLLLAVAFYGGFMVGRNGSGHKVTAVPTAQEETGAGPQATGSGGETHVVSAGPGASSDQSSSASSNGSGSQELQPARSRQTDQPLGSAKHKAAVKNDTAEAEPAGATASEGFAPQVGQEFLQVAAVSRLEAEAVADVLHKKGFRAHAVPKPGNPQLYRVIIGPIRNPGELSSTREALTRTGFREVILQRY